MDDFTAWMARSGYAPRTREDYRRVVERWRRSGLTADDWLAQVHNRTRREHGAPTATAQTYAKALKAWHRFKGVDWAARLPYSVRKARPKPAVVLTAPQEARVRSAVAHLAREPQATATRLLQATGARVLAVTRLELRDVTTDPAGGVALVIRPELTKTREGRTVPLTAAAARELVTYLRGWRATRPQTPWLFPSRHKGGQAPITARAVRQFVAEVGEHAGVPGLHPHAFRHTVATRLLETGTPPEVIRQVVGHVDVGGGQKTVLDRYLHPGPTTLRQALEASGR